MSISKPALTRKEMISLLKNRNLKFNSESNAIEILKRLNYQKLMVYRFKFLEDSINFIPNTTFENIYDLYKFDRDLKFLILELVESVELALRTQIAYELGHKYSIHCHFENNIFLNPDFHNNLLSKLSYKFDMSNIDRPLIIVYHQNKYKDQLPIYKFIELLTLGQLSKVFKNLKIEDRDLITKTYYKNRYHKINSKHLTSWFLTITEVRNICAHHEKLYNRIFEISPLKHKDWKDISNKTSKGKEIFTIYGIFLVFKYIIQDKELFNESVDKLDILFQKYSAIINPMEDLRFPSNWKEALKL